MSINISPMKLTRKLSIKVLTELIRKKWNEINKISIQRIRIIHTCKSVLICPQVSKAKFKASTIRIKARFQVQVWFLKAVAFKIMKYHKWTSQRASYETWGLVLFKQIDHCQQQRSGQVINKAEENEGCLVQMLRRATVAQQTKNLSTLTIRWLIKLIQCMCKIPKFKTCKVSKFTKTKTSKCKDQTNKYTFKIKLTWWQCKELIIIKEVQDTLMDLLNNLRWTKECEFNLKFSTGKFHHK